MEYGSVGMSQDNPGQVFPLSLCPGTKKILVLLSLCPGTAKILGQTFFTLFFLLFHGCPGILRDGTGQTVKIQSQPVRWQNTKIPSRSVLYHNVKIPSRKKILTLSRCPFVPRDETVLSRWLLLFKCNRNVSRQQNFKIINRSMYCVCNLS